MEDLTTWLTGNKDWLWLAVGVVLLMCEMLIPGAFMMWVGFAALITGAVVFAFDGMTLEIQGLIFALLSIGSVLVGRRIMKSSPTTSDNETLNKRGTNHIGKKYVLDEAIENGSGRAKVGDSVWACEGVDTAAGTLVEVTDVRGAVLIVKKSGE